MTAGVGGRGSPARRSCCWSGSSPSCSCCSPAASSSSAAATGCRASSPGPGRSAASPAPASPPRRSAPCARAARSPATALTPGRYLSTAYGPPWGGIQGAGQARAAGWSIAGGAPRWYMIAVDPLLIGHGRLVYAWPNPFGWPGPFLAADTGAAILGRRLDFYDWRGRPTQLRWGQRAGPGQRAPDRPRRPRHQHRRAGGVLRAPVSSDVGERIGQLARAQLGRGPAIPGVRAPARRLRLVRLVCHQRLAQGRRPDPRRRLVGLPLHLGPGARPAVQGDRRCAPTARCRRWARR